MLTLKAPIQLHIVQGLTGNAEVFGEKIRGNYDLLAAKVAPKELLFLMTAPPELPEDLGGMTTLVSQQTKVDARSVNLEVINNVVNRILLDGTNQFTYQDQVYITTVLNRLGITNVEQFMEQVRQLRIENENTVQLTRMYRSQLEKILRQKAEGTQAPALPLDVSESGGEETVFRDPRVELSMEIFNRLQTANLYESVHAFQHNWSQQSNAFQSNELKLSEQLRFSSSVNLAQMKQQFFRNPHLELHHHLNQYEAGTILEVPVDEEGVLSQAAAAALLTAVDNTVTQVLHRPQFFENRWVRLENAIWQTAENSLNRFETYHSQTSLLPPRRERTVEAVWNRYTREVGDYLNLYQQIYPAGTRLEGRYTLPPEMVNRLTYLTRLEEGDTLLEEGDTSLQINQIQRGRLLRELMATEAATRARPVDRLIQRKLRYHNEREQWERQQWRELERYQTQTKQDFTERTVAEITMPRQPIPLRNEETSGLPPLELTPREAETLAPEVLEQQVQQIDEHNRIVLQSVQQEILKRDTGPKQVAPDLKRTMQDALRALENPDQIIREFYTKPAEPAMVHPELTAREEAILSKADPATRALYERVLLYEKSPELALARGLVKPGNLGAFQAEIRQAVQEGTVPVLEQAERLEQMEHLERETVLEQFREYAARRKEEIPPQASEVVRLDHREILPGESEAWLEERERELHRTRENLVTRELDRAQTLVEEQLRQILRRPGEIMVEAEPEMVRLEHGEIHPGVSELQIEEREREVRRTQSREVTREVDRAQSVVEQVLHNTVYRPGESAAETRPGVIRMEHREILPGGTEVWLDEEGRELYRVEHTGMTREVTQTQTVLEQLRQIPDKTRVVDVPGTPAAIRMVHKQAAPEVTEQLLEQLEQQRTRKVVHSEDREEITRQNVHRTEVNQIEHQLVTQTSEQVTELVNRALNRQMRTITDQVYRQMEKRLQTERSRRGRL